MSTTSARLVLLTVCVLPLGGCCSMARLFCGPDRSAWVPVSYDSPAATLATFLEAVRRDDSAKVYESLAASFKAQHGLDGMVVNAAWERLRNEVTGLHLLGYAEVPNEPVQAQDGGVTYLVATEGVTIRIDLVRQSFWELQYRGRDGKPRETSAALDFDTLNGLLRVEAAEPDPEDDLPQARIALEPRLVMHPGSPSLQLSDVDRLAVGREWKIAEIRQVADR
ncbi:MAG: hypothetical protein ABL997_13150 [Planctomycetota bacterium]